MRVKLRGLIGLPYLQKFMNPNANYPAVPAIESNAQTNAVDFAMTLNQLKKFLGYSYIHGMNPLRVLGLTSRKTR